MDVNNKKVFQVLNLNKVWVPLLLGLGVVAYLFSTDPDIKISQFKLVQEGNLLYIIGALVLVLIRDLGYMLRIRTLSHHTLTWLSCFSIIVLWEFSSAVTPSVVGGTLVAVFLFLKEGVKLGKALAYVMVTALFDNLFFIIAAPLGLANTRQYLHAENGLASQLGGGINVVFWLSYGLIFIYTCLMAFAMFVKPNFFKWLLVKVTSIPFLKRFREGAVNQGNDIMLAAEALKEETVMYWIAIGSITFFVWLARYGVLNFLIAAYVPVDFTANIHILGKHIIMWVVMLISPTPGSSGTAEYFFKQLYGGLLGNYVLIVALIWRIITYYFYLMLGVFMLPRWLKKNRTVSIT